VEARSVRGYLENSRCDSFRPDNGYGTTIHVAEFYSSQAPIGLGIDPPDYKSEIVPPHRGNEYYTEFPKKFKGNSEKVFYKVRPPSIFSYRTIAILFRDGRINAVVFAVSKVFPKR